MTPSPFHHLTMLVSLMLVSMNIAACSRSASDSPATPSSAVPAPVGPPVIGSGVIRGIVHFTGNPPAASSTTDIADPQNCMSPTHPSLGIVVNANRTLKNVVIYLANPPRPVPAAPALPALLDQVACEYQPHVVAIQTGQVLHVRSSDTMPHNVHMLCQANPVQNFGMLHSGDAQDITFAHPEIFTAKCDVHSWMSAVVAVFDHPYFAVSGVDGSFEIDRVPAGPYTLVAWQETLPSQTQSITVADPGVTHSDFTFAMP